MAFCAAVIEDQSSKNSSSNCVSFSPIIPPPVVVILISTFDSLFIASVMISGSMAFLLANEGCRISIGSLLTLTLPLPALTLL